MLVQLNGTKSDTQSNNIKHPLNPVVEPDWPAE